jgi:hypothetical protein
MFFWQKSQFFHTGTVFGGLTPQARAGATN